MFGPAPSRKREPLTEAELKRLDAAILDGVSADVLRVRFRVPTTLITERRIVLGIEPRHVVGAVLSKGDRQRLSVVVDSFAPLPPDKRHRYKRR